MSKIAVLAEQTQFLLDKQQEVLNFFNKEFETIYALLESEQKKAEQSKAGAELISFQNTFALLSEHEQKLATQMEDDISFLKEQLDAINQIASMEDQSQAEELTNMLLDEDHVLEDTSQFKADVEQEAEQAKESFRIIASDIKSTLLEAGVKELEILLEAHMAAMESEEDEEEALESVETESDCSASCHSCSGCNIFQGLEEVENRQDADVLSDTNDDDASNKPK